MDYFLKANALIALFYALYIFGLQKETFFSGNRWFLLSGLIVSVLLPLVIIPIYIYQAPVTYQFTTVPTLNNQTAASPITWLNVATLLYGLGVLFFIIKFVLELISLKVFISKLNITKKQGYNIALTNDQISPFSFFKYIVFNPNQFTETELTHIQNHEKVHASEYHSIDILLSKLSTILFWFNPIIWLYKKAVIQNLEYIADCKSITQNTSTKTYQKVLLKTAVPSHQMALTTNFYNSLIKKRILMLNTSKSKTIHALKYAIIAPVLFIFMMSFNTKTVYKTKDQTSSVHLNSESEISVIITKDDSDAQLEALVETFAIQNVILKIGKTKRNAASEITAISIKASSENSNVAYTKDSDTPISPIKISFNSSTNTVKIGESQPSSDIVFTSTKNASKVDSNNKNSFVINTSDGASITVKKLGEDDTDQNVMFISEDGKTTHVTTKSEIVVQKQDNNTIQYRSSDNETPLIFVDGKETTKQDMEAINPDTIDSVNVLKGETAIAKYGDKGKDGVIEITTKTNTGINNNTTQTSDIKVIGYAETNSPLIIVDGKEVKGKSMDDFNPDSIDKMNVLKGENAIAKYGDKGKDGAIEIVTKSSKANANPWKVSTGIKLSNGEDQMVNTNTIYFIDGKASTPKEVGEINPDKIESIDVLKDKAAIEKYGDKGKDGVILITTKK